MIRLNHLSFMSKQVLRSPFNLRERSLFVAGGRGGAPKRNEFGKQHFGRVKGRVNEK